MSNPFFSVIIPAHNSAKYIRNGLDSIRAQTFMDYELIVVCDKCTDTTSLVAAEYTDKILAVNYGLDGMARNAGIDVADGQFILFMDDDDWFLHEYVFSQLADHLGKNQCDVLLFSFIWRLRGYTSQTISRRIACWAKCWRRSWIGDTRFPAKPYWSDVDFDREMFGKPGVKLTWDMPIYYYNYLMQGSISWRQKVGEIE